MRIKRYAISVVLVGACLAAGTVWGQHGSHTIMPARMHHLAMDHGESDFSTQRNGPVECDIRQSRRRFPEEVIAGQGCEDVSSNPTRYRTPDLPPDAAMFSAAVRACDWNCSQHIPRQVPAAAQR